MRDNVRSLHRLPSLEDEQELFDEMRETRQAIKNFAIRYSELIEKAVQLGYANMKIAREVGVTEAAIRQMRKRIEERNG